MQDEINKALQILRNGGTILYPTDTIWGIGCDATNQQAVEKIISIKKRTEHKSFVVLMNSTAMMEQYLENIPEIAFTLIDITNKPLTLILHGAKNLAPGVIAPDGSAGIRIPAYDFCIRLISRLGKPLVSTSANITTMDTPEKYNQISTEILTAVDYIVQTDNPDASGKPSSIIKIWPDHTIKIIRH